MPWRKNTMEAYHHWRMYRIFLFANYSFLARILLLTSESRGLLATCKQHLQYYSFLFQGMFQCALTIAPIDNNTHCQSHTACCVGIWGLERHTVWLKARLILLWKEATERNAACLEDCFIFGRNTPSWNKWCLSWDNCSWWMKGEFWRISPRWHYIR